MWGIEVLLMLSSLFSSQLFMLYANKLALVSAALAWPPLPSAVHLLLREICNRLGPKHCCIRVPP